MRHTLHPTIAAYVEASNARDPDAVVRCFTPNAVVADEGKTYCGSEEIRRWSVETQQAYDFTLEALDAAGRGGETIVTCRLAGRFPGSPIELPFCFTLEADRIAALRIGA